MRQASRIFNKQAQKEPLVVMQPKNPAAVAQILRLAVAHDIPVTVKGGGHSPAGWSVEEGLLHTTSKLSISNGCRTAHFVNCIHDKDPCRIGCKKKAIQQVKRENSNLCMSLLLKLGLVANLFCSLIMCLWWMSCELKS